MNRILCKLFGHKFKVYHRKKSRTGPELNEFKKCKRCKHTVKMTFAMIHEQRMKAVADSDLVWRVDREMDELLQRKTDEIMKKRKEETNEEADYRTGSGVVGSDDTGNRTGG